MAGPFPWESMPETEWHVAVDPALFEAIRQWPVEDRALRALLDVVAHVEHISPHVDRVRWRLVVKVRVRNLTE
jgi:hypothetical protein